MDQARNDKARGNITSVRNKSKTSLRLNIAAISVMIVTWVAIGACVGAAMRTERLSSLLTSSPELISSQAATQTTTTQSSTSQTPTQLPTSHAQTTTPPPTTPPPTTPPQTTASSTIPPPTTASPTIPPPVTTQPPTTQTSPTPPPVYIQNCSNIALSGTVLSATCTNTAGIPNYSQIDLNNYVSNHEGTLIWAYSNGHFAATCSSITLQGATLYAACLNSNGARITSRISVNQRVSNTGGYLVFDSSGLQAPTTPAPTTRAPTSAPIYFQNCTNIALSATILSATCWNSAGLSSFPNIDLNIYITNNNGVFNWSPSSYGNFAASCSSITLQGATLSASCRDVSGVSRTTTISVNQRISNVGGKLIFT